MVPSGLSLPGVVRWGGVLALCLLSIMATAIRADEPTRHDIGLKDGVHLEAYLYKPFPQVRDVPVVIVLHGFNGSAEAVSDSARLLTLEGYAALTLSMRGWGASGGTDDCGKRQGSDLAEIVDWLRRQDGIDAERVGALGYSQGGQVALLGAAMTGHLRSVVAFFPVTDVDRWGKTSRHEGVRAYVKSVCSEDFAARSPMTVAADINAPVLLVHGGRDSRVPTEQSILMQRAIKNAGGTARLHLVPGARHLFDEEDWKSAWRAAVTHLNDTLRPGKPEVAEVRSFSSVFPETAEDRVSYLVAWPNYPVLSVLHPDAVSLEVFELSPGCASCGARLLESMASGAGHTNYVMSFSASKDAEIDAISELFCGTPSGILKNIVVYFDALSRSDFSHGTLSERELLDLYAELASRAAGLDASNQKQCMENTEFRKNIAAVGLKETRRDPATAARIKDYHPDILSGLRSYRIQGGVGVGPSYEALSPEETRALEEEVERAFNDIERQNRKMKLLDVAILGAQSVDIFIGKTASVVPGGGAVYSGSKAIGYIVMGEKDEATESAIGIGTSVLGPFGEGVDFAMDVATLSETIGRFMND